MKRRVWLGLCIAATAAWASGPLAALAADEDGPPKKVTRWVFQPAFDSSDAGWAKGLMPWVKAVEEATQGTVKIRVEPVGALTSGSEAFGAAAAGMTDGYAGWATVYGGEMPAGMLAYGLAMGAENSQESWDIMWGDPRYRVGELVQAAANARNLHWAGWTDQGPNAMFTTFPVNSIDDFKGKKMRAGGPQALFHQAIGGVPVAMEAGDIYTSIKLGTIEGTYWDTGGIADMHFEEIIKYAVLPGWNPSQHQEIFINLDAWKALTPWQRKQIDGIFESTYFETSRMHAEGAETALQALAAAGGKVVNLSDEELARMRQISIDKVWPKVAEGAPENAEGVKRWMQYLKDHGKL